MTQPFQPVGNDGGILQFHTDSWSRPSHPGHELTLTLSNLTVHCSCEDAVCRVKNHRKVTDLGLCKHCAVFQKMVWPVIARAIGASACEVPA